MKTVTLKSAGQFGRDSSATTASDTGPRAAAPAFALRKAQITLHELIDPYMAAYGGRDTTQRGQRLAWWHRRLGSLALVDPDGDHVHSALQELAAQRGRHWAGLDADGNAIYKAKGNDYAPARSIATERRCQRRSLGRSRNASLSTVGPIRAKTSSAFPSTRSRTVRKSASRCSASASAQRGTRYICWSLPKQTSGATILSSTLESVNVCATAPNIHE